MARGDTLLAPSKNKAINVMRATNRGGGPKAAANKIAGRLGAGLAGAGPRSIFHTKPMGNIVKTRGKNAGKMNLAGGGRSH
jgi:hypothetical protein